MIFPKGWAYDISNTCQISLLFVFWTVGAHVFAKKNFWNVFLFVLDKKDAETIFGEVSDRKQAFLGDTEKFDFTIVAKLVTAFVTDSLNRLYRASAN